MCREQSRSSPTTINVVTTTTFIVQIIEPPCVKFAIIRAGEARFGRT